MDSLTLDHTLTIHPRVSVRPEPFGALLYHFGTRQLSFLKDRHLLDAVRACDGRRTVGEALVEAAVPAAQLERYRGALATLVESRMLIDAAESEVAA
ncbi:MAG: mycofactocin biosynthesis chaperone MftB [Actinobacteria bacterium]|nr:mycofactocin biosynthesis chaperone MftB [Actinomycetota bacterium]MBU1608693.1 mycofactocin biosynthesis chaperone MftB [Actinomycetota bacterium]MBU2315871.1 mycofactocin biosynthesis chaperone MftB [Actinomycetota bacterium]MBU2384420.1 mycofactocin biosynthesis chaperone MftB [Actinomycetota bacterium]